MKQHYSFMSKCFCAIFLAMIINVASVKHALAQTQVATLKHGDQISVFYGATALSEAHETAEAGDVITLSSGAFTLDTLTKAITLHGAGFVTDTVSGTAPTIINSDVTANISDMGTPLTIEGILFSRTFTAIGLSNPRIIKCYFNSFVTGENTIMMTQSQFVNCRFSNLSIQQSTNSSFVNCVIWRIDASGSGMESYNSYIHIVVDRITMSVFNCVVSNYGYPHPQLSSNSVAFNCIGTKSNTNNVFLYAFTENCWVYDNLSSVIANYSNSPNNLTEPLILKEEIANTCIGTDGTEVGIHGGPHPYNDHPFYMTIKHCTVGNRTTDDGHLSVDIEVVTEQ